MKLLKASIENFLIIKKAEVPLDAKALVLVLGYSIDGGQADSNGVGKSSLFEAICWCLYGKTYKGISHDDVVNNRCKGGTRVELSLVIDDETLTVIRHRKHSKHKNKLLIFKGDKNVTPFSQKDAEIVLESLLPLSYNAFKHVCYFGQGMADKFLALNDSGRKHLLEELLGMEAYTSAEKRAKLVCKEFTNRNIRLAGKKEVLERNIEAEEAKLVAFESSKAESVAEINKQRGALDKDLDTLEVSVLTAETQLEVRGKRKDLFSDQLEDAQTELKDLERKESRLESKKMESTVTLCALKRTMKKVSELQQCSECEQEVPEDHTLARLAELQKEVEEHDLATNGIQHKLDELETPITDQVELVEALEAKLESIDVVTPLIELNRTKGLIKRNKEIRGELALREAAITAPSQGLREALQASQEDLVVVDDELAQIALEKPYYDFWEKGFSTTGVRSLLLDDVITYLNSRINHHSRAISDGEISIQLAPQTKLKSGDLREKMSVKASTGGAGYKAASGGQQRRMDLAVHFALSDLTSTITGHRVNLLICDEVLDCIDETGTDAILSMLEEKTRREMTVFLIDHTDAVKDNVNKILVVSQENGVSTTELIDG